MVVDVCSLCINILLFCHVYASEPTIPQVAMDERCHRSLDVVEAFVLTLTEKLSYQPGMDCQLTLQARAGHRIMLRFLYLQIHTNDTIKECEDFVAINYGRSILFSHLTPVICRTKPTGSMVTANTTASIHFHSNAYGEDSGFQLLVTPFHTGSCYSSEFRCNNGRCIQGNMYCNKYNNCGDNSDSCNSSDVNYSATIYMSAAIILCVVLLIVIVSMCFCCAKSSRKRRRRRRRRSARHSRQHARELCEAYDNPVGPFSLNDLPPYLDIPSYPPPAYSTLPRTHAQSRGTDITTETAFDRTPVENPNDGTRILRDIHVEETSTSTPEHGTIAFDTSAADDTSETGSSGDTPVRSTPGDTPERRTPGDTPVKGIPGDTPERRTPGDTPVKGTPGDTPERITPGDTPVRSTPGDTHVRSTPGDTPERSTPGDTPKRSTPGDTPERSTPGDTPVRSTPGDITESTPEGTP
ncbi:uncharacterized protein [Haliotis cracherodii]|uniref:uncharacterized protein n=1 Tax=Haliotis cracherodii TaxID=6455 RepID=UPI0039EC2EBC